MTTQVTVDGRQGTVIDELSQAVLVRFADGDEVWHHRADVASQCCGEMTCGPDDLVRPCVLPAGHDGYHDTGR